MWIVNCFNSVCHPGSSPAVASNEGKSFHILSVDWTGQDRTGSLTPSPFPPWEITLLPQQNPLAFVHTDSISRLSSVFPFSLSHEMVSNVCNTVWFFWPGDSLDERNRQAERDSAVKKWLRQFLEPKITDTEVLGALRPCSVGVSVESNPRSRRVSSGMSIVSLTVTLFIMSSVCVFQQSVCLFLPSVCSFHQSRDVTEAATGEGDQEKLELGGKKCVVLWISNGKNQNTQGGTSFHCFPSFSYTPPFLLFYL